MPGPGFEYKQAAQHTFAATELADISPPNSTKPNSFLSDLMSSGDPDKPITCGFYRQEKGDKLVYTYDYEELKIIVEGTYIISDHTGKSVIARPGDVFHFHNGDTITFDSPSYGLAFFCGQKKMGHV